MGNSEKESISKQIAYEIFLQFDAELEVHHRWLLRRSERGFGFGVSAGLGCGLANDKARPTFLSKDLRRIPTRFTTQISVCSFLSCRRKPSRRDCLFPPKTQTDRLESPSLIRFSVSEWRLPIEPIRQKREHAMLSKQR